LSLQQVNGLYIASSGIHDRGVFCAIDIEKGSLIEIAPVVVLRNTDRAMLDNTDLYDYYFIWGKEQYPAIVLGYGSIYNHSPDANAFFTIDREQRLMLYEALRFIPAGTEITVDYHAGEPDKPLWFDVVSPM